MKLKVILLGLLLIFLNNAIYAQDSGELYTVSVGKSIGLEDPKKFFPLLGYSVQFPENISSSHMLIDISLGVGLTKEVTKAEGKTLEEKMTAAIEDNDALAILNKYNPFRQMAGFYSNKNRKSIIVAATMPTKAFEEIERKEKNKTNFDDKQSKNFMIENIKCFWSQLHEDNKYHSLVWHKDGVSYMIFPIEGKDFTVDEAANIAKKIIDANK
ncbi:MAG: DUF4367 domain-containing protein [Spirochaetes bacterium]|nr:DUF4367 domain-containing protein [Spirochaetota bacterium]